MEGVTDGAWTFAAGADSASTFFGGACSEMGFAATSAWIGAVDRFPPSHDHQAAVQIPIVMAMLAATTGPRVFIHSRTGAAGGCAVTLGDEATPSLLIA